jgi:hypothetical protein
MTLHRVSNTKQGQRNQYQCAITHVTHFNECRGPVVNMYLWVPSLVFSLKSSWFGNVLLVFLSFSQKYWNITFKWTTRPTFYIPTTINPWKIWGIVEDPSLQGRDSWSLDKWIPTFRKIVISSCSRVWLLNLWRRWRYKPSKGRELFNQLHRVTTENVLLFKYHPTRCYISYTIQSR